MHQHFKATDPEYAMTPEHAALPYPVTRVSQCRINSAEAAHQSSSDLAKSRYAAELKRREETNTGSNASDEAKAGAAYSNFTWEVTHMLVTLTHQQAEGSSSCRFHCTCCHISAHQAVFRCSRRLGEAERHHAAYVTLPFSTAIM